MEWASAQALASVQAWAMAQAQEGAPALAGALGQAEAVEPEEVLEPVRAPVRVPALAPAPVWEREWASAERPGLEWAQAGVAAKPRGELPEPGSLRWISADLLLRKREEA
jgi:hypothetical protein